MTKKLLILSLIISGSLWAEEDEFPMKLTCENWDSFVYIYVAEDITKSWFQYHPLPPLQTSASNMFQFGTEKLFVKCGKKERRFTGKAAYCYVNKDHIHLARNHFSQPLRIIVNRRTMKAVQYRGKFVEETGAQCFKGFKEYK
jgi:hypothetical protein